MDQCRACLSTEKQMFPIDEKLVSNYNILTSLELPKLVITELEQGDEEDKTDEPEPPPSIKETLEAPKIFRKVKLSDEMSHVICEICLQTVNYFINFREKCISSECTLKSIHELKLEVIKEIKEEEVEVELKQDTDNNDIKIEFEFDECENDFLEPIHSVNEVTDGDGTGVPSSSKDLKIVTKKQRKKRKITKKITPPSQLSCDLKIVKKDHTKKRKPPKEIIPPSQLSCGLCPKEFDDKQLLMEHLESHSLERQCKICSKTFKDWPAFVTHRVEHVPKNQIFCHICKMWFLTHTSIEYHYRRIHYNEKDFRPKCHVCNQTFETPRKQRKHANQVHSERTFVCDYCTKVYNSKSSFISHIRTHQDRRQYACDVCEYTCKHPSNLTAHKLRRHALKKFNCAKCKRVFENERGRDKHSCKPTDILCPVCGKQLKRRTLASHMLSHTTEAKYKCPQCPKVFKGKQALLIHINRHDGNRTKQCEYCPAKFYCTSVLIKHRRTHTGEKPYVCKICQKGFTGNHNLKVHMKVHGEFLVAKKDKTEGD